MYQRSELDWLIYNDPLAYADLVINKNIKEYLKLVTSYEPLAGSEQIHHKGGVAIAASPKLIILFL